MVYLLITILLFAALLVYFRVALAYRIIDKPNDRSSHAKVTIRGGGVVFPIAMILYAIFFHHISMALLGSMVLISMVSFWDDMTDLPRKVRLLAHVTAVSGLLYTVQIALLPIWFIPILYVLIIGIINAYNFMDGINGITGLYSLVVLTSFWFLNKFEVPFTDPSFIITAGIACMVFLFFNFRKKAVCFAGDVGSVGIGFWVIALLLMAILKTQEVKYFLFLAVYGVDTVLTIIHRLLLKQNILEAHRFHFYQLLANEGKMPHLWVSILYAGLQLMINAFILFADCSTWLTALIICVPLILTYILVKPLLMAKGEKIQE